jgi:hypothetical protein
MQPGDDPIRASRDAVAITADTNWLDGIRVLVTGAAGALGAALVAEPSRSDRGRLRPPSEDRHGTASASGDRIAANLRDPDGCRRLVRD